jgi:hypothetical protein
MEESNFAQANLATYLQVLRRRLPWVIQEVHSIERPSTSFEWEGWRKCHCKIGD